MRRVTEEGWQEGFRYAVILPARNEEECIGPVLGELMDALDDRFVAVVGVNGSTDRTAQRALESGALVGVAEDVGYGAGCLAAICRLEEFQAPRDGYVFCAADGAGDPGDVLRVIVAHVGGDGDEGGFDMVIGSRALPGRSTLRGMRKWMNRLLGGYCLLLTGRHFWDLGPLRFFTTALYRRMDLRERTFGWTIEAQVVAARLGARIREIPVGERPRIAGEQKVTGVSFRHTLSVGMEILQAGWRARQRIRL